MISFVLLSLLACSVHAETLAGRVVGIADGDMITVLDANRQQHKTLQMLKCYTHLRSQDTADMLAAAGA